MPKGIRKNPRVDIDQMRKVLTAMPKRFTSFDFSNTARAMGVLNSAHTESGSVSRFLHKQTDVEQLSGQTWRKMCEPKVIEPKSPEPKTGLSDYDETCIKHVKSLGYKILAPEITFKEI